MYTTFLFFMAASLAKTVISIPSDDQFPTNLSSNKNALQWINTVKKIIKERNEQQNVERYTMKDIIFILTLIATVFHFPNEAPKTPGYSDLDAMFEEHNEWKKNYESIMNRPTIMIPKIPEWNFNEILSRTTRPTKSFLQIYNERRSASRRRRSEERFTVLLYVIGGVIVFFCAIFLIVGVCLVYDRLYKMCVKKKSVEQNRDQCRV